MQKVKVNRICPSCQYSDDVTVKLTLYQGQQLRELGRAYVACPVCGEYPMAALIVHDEPVPIKEPAFGKAPKLNAAWLFKKKEAKT